MSEGSIDVGSVWRQELLGTAALYEVAEDLGEIVLVTVREAPGLEPGAQLRMTRTALTEMARVSGSAARTTRS